MENNMVSGNICTQHAPAAEGQRRSQTVTYYGRIHVHTFAIMLLPGTSDPYNVYNV